MGSSIRSIKQRPPKDSDLDNPEEGAEDPGQAMMRYENQQQSARQKEQDELDQSEMRNENERRRLLREYNDFLRDMERRQRDSPEPPPAHRREMQHTSLFNYGRT